VSLLILYRASACKCRGMDAQHALQCLVYGQRIASLGEIGEYHRRDPDR
jgi:hypothetical protein